MKPPGVLASYKLKFPESPTYSSIPQNVGGFMDYYSSYGPVQLNYTLKPDISAPGEPCLRRPAAASWT